MKRLLLFLPIFLFATLFYPKKSAEEFYKINKAYIESVKLSNTVEKLLSNKYFKRSLFLGEIGTKVYSVDLLKVLARILNGEGNDGGVIKILKDYKESHKILDLPISVKKSIINSILSSGFVVELKKIERDLQSLKNVSKSKRIKLSKALIKRLDYILLAYIQDLKQSNSKEASKKILFRFKSKRHKDA
jgi:hypothetical protein